MASRIIMNKTVGIITYHGLHNYGAMLQAFALQTVMKNLGFGCEIINFRTEGQKRYYLPVYKKGNSFFERLAKRLFLAPYKSDILAKHQLFEAFLKNEMSLSQNYATLNELMENPPNYDFYISGSDQVWNIFGPNFSWANYLPFVNNNGKRIAYAPSMVLQNAIEKLTEKEEQKIKEYLNDYDFISVREDSTANNIKRIIGKKPEIVLDPTLLFEKKQWLNYFDNSPIIDGEYLFYYTPSYNSNALKITRELSKKLNIKVVTSIVHSAKFVLTYHDFTKEVAVGPFEFLNLCNNAKFICGQSLHLVAFAIAFNKPFFVTDGMTNKRTRDLLETTNLINRSISLDDFEEKIKYAFDIDFTEANQILKEKRTESFNYLTEALK